MIRGSLSPPPQMGNGGSPPTHLPSSTALDSFFPSVANFPVAAKWKQPPARASKEFTAAFADVDQALARIRAETARALDFIFSDGDRALARRRAKTDRAALAEERRRDDAERALRCRHETERSLARERTLAEEATARARQGEAARTRQEEAARRQQLLDELAACARQECCSH